MKRLVAVAVISVWVAFPAAGKSGDGSCESPHHLDSKASALKEAFNAAATQTRLLFVIDPVCPACLRGTDQMNKAVLAQAKDARLSTFVVHLPVIGGKEGDAKRTCKLLTGPRVVHFWDGSGDFGRSLSRGLELKNKKGELVYAWDVWLLYPPGTLWSGEDPPKPKKIMHQLMSLSDGSSYEFLDADAFANEVTATLRNSK